MHRVSLSVANPCGIRMHFGTVKGKRETKPDKRVGALTQTRWKTKRRDEEEKERGEREEESKPKLHTASNAKQHAADVLVCEYLSIVQNN